MDFAMMQVIGFLIILAAMVISLFAAFFLAVNEGFSRRVIALLVVGLICTATIIYIFNSFL